MVIVVPTLAVSRQCNQEVVATRVVSDITPTSENVRNRVDQKCVVPQRDCSHKESEEQT